jgi:hypothetical protein
VEKPEHLSARDLSPGIHLEGAAAASRDQPIGYWFGDYPRSVRAASVNDDDFRFGSDAAPQALEASSEQPSFVQDRKNDGEEGRAGVHHSLL